MLLWKVARECRPEGQRLAHSTSGVPDTEPSALLRSGEGHLYCVHSCSHILGSHQRQDPVFRHDARLANVAVDHQTRCVGSDKIQRAPRDPKIQERDPAVGCTSPRAPQVLQPWVTGLWLGRDTLRGEHLIGTVGRSHEKLRSPPSTGPCSMGARSSTGHVLLTLGATSESSRSSSSTKTD